MPLRTTLTAIGLGWMQYEALGAVTVRGAELASDSEPVLVLTSDPEAASQPTTPSDAPPVDSRVAVAEAIKTNDVHTLRQLATQPGVDFNAPDEEGVTPLLKWVATPANDSTEAVLQALLAGGANIDLESAATSDGRSMPALWFAVKKGSVEKFNLLLQHGADVRVICSGAQGRNLLDYAFSVMRREGFSPERQAMIDTLLARGLTYTPRIPFPSWVAMGMGVIPAVSAVMGAAMQASTHQHAGIAYPIASASVSAWALGSAGIALALPSLTPIDRNGLLGAYLLWPLLAASAFSAGARSVRTYRHSQMQCGLDQFNTLADREPLTRFLAALDDNKACSDVDRALSCQILKTAYSATTPELLPRLLPSGNTVSDYFLNLHIREGHRYDITVSGDGGDAVLPVKRDWGFRQVPASPINTALQEVVQLIATQFETEMRKPEMIEREAAHQALTVGLRAATRMQATDSSSAGTTPNRALTAFIEAGDRYQKQMQLAPTPASSSATLSAATPPPPGGAARSGPHADPRYLAG